MNATPQPSTEASSQPKDAPQATPKQAEKAAKDWLKTLSKKGGQWQKLAKLAALVQAVMIVGQAWFFAQLLHRVIMESQPAAELLPLFGAAVGATVLRFVAAWCRGAAAQRASLQAQQQLRSELIDQLYALGPAWRAQQRGGELVSQLQEQVAAVDGYIARYLPQMGLVTTVPLLILLAIAPISWAAALIFLFTAPLIPIFMALVGLKAKSKQVEQQQKLARMSGYFLDQLRGLPTLQLFNRHHAQIAVVADVTEDFRVQVMRVLRLVFLSSAVLEFFASVSIAMTAVYCGFTFLNFIDFGLYGQPMTLATGFFILLLAPEFYLPLRELGTHYHAKSDAEAAAEQLYPWITAQTAQMQGGDQAPPDGAVDLALRGVSFSYPSHQGTELIVSAELTASAEPTTSSPLLSSADLTIKAGKTTVLLGASGTGKTSILRLLLGQLSPQHGDVLIGDRPLNELDIHAWRDAVGWMSQHPHLLAGTLRANLRLGASDATDAQLLAALHFVELDDWLAQLPQGLATRLGEDGRQLSGGQLRRLALARVYLSNADILLFDEPTASLDETLEATLLAKMRDLCRGKTVLLLTHRSAPLALADYVAVLADGKCRVGTPDAMQTTVPQVAAFLQENVNADKTI